MRTDRRHFLALAAAAVFGSRGAAAQPPHYDTLLRGGTVYDGTGAPGTRVDVGIADGRIVAVGRLDSRKARRVVDVSGLAVAPGFVNMLSQSVQSFLLDGRSESDIRQGVTLELVGEGETMGPLNPAMKAALQDYARPLGLTVDWTTQAEYMERLERQGVSPNIASFVGATTLRIHVIGYENRKATPAELDSMQALARQAMDDGAFGLTSAVQYAPAVYADTAELTALAAVVAPYGGLYITHMRDEGDRLLEAVDEVIAIARDAGVAAEIYHLKASGEANWPKLDAVIAKIERARAEGLRITADMYPYTAAFTGLDLTMPPWVQEGGDEAWIARLRDPAVRARVIDEMRHPPAGWSSALVSAGSADKIRILGVRNPALQPVVGKTIADVARERRVSAEDAIIDLVVADGSRLQVAYFVMSEANVRKEIVLPWVAFGSDADSIAAEGDVLKQSDHPRGFGTFARVLGRYVREEKLIALPEAIRRLSGFPASTLGITDRGTIRAGNHADIVVFDPATIADRATFDAPHLYAVGMRHVFVNGVQVIADGEHTGAKPGRYVRGPHSKPR